MKTPQAADETAEEGPDWWIEKTSIGTNDQAVPHLFRNCGECGQPTHMQQVVWLSEPQMLRWKAIKQHGYSAFWNLFPSDATSSAMGVAGIVGVLAIFVKDQRILMGVGLLLIALAIIAWVRSIFADRAREKMRREFVQEFVHKVVKLGEVRDAPLHGRLDLEKVRYVVVPEGVQNSDDYLAYLERK